MSLLDRASRWARETDGPEWIGFLLVAALSACVGLVMLDVLFALVFG